jgi:ABC-type taurine transport system ATPase subunit
VVALSDINLSVEDGKFIAIVGSSGCGKLSSSIRSPGCSLLRRGSVTIDGNKVAGPDIDRSVVFQHSSLLPR